MSRLLDLLLRSRAPVEAPRFPEYTAAAASRDAQCGALRSSDRGFVNGEYTMLPRNEPARDWLDDYHAIFELAAQRCLARRWRPAFATVSPALWARMKRDRFNLFSARMWSGSTFTTHAYDLATGASVWCLTTAYGRWDLRENEAQEEPVRFFRHGEVGVAQFLRVEVC